MLQLVQCWDDGVEDDLRLVALLRQHRAKATFNLNPGLHGSARSRPWRYRGVKDVARLARGELVETYAGFTIANHSVSHPRPTQIPLADWRREVEDGRKHLQDLFQQPILGFAYPFGDCDATTAAVVREAGHVYARTVANVTPSGPAPDLYQQPTDCHFASPAFWDRLALAKAARAPFFYFWGHSYELLTEADWASLDAQFARLGADPDLVWADLPVALTAT